MKWKKKPVIGRHAVRGNSDSALGVELEVGRLTLDGLRIRWIIAM